MSKKIVCQIPGNVQLTLENHSKLMTLIYSYGVNQIATLLERAQLLLNENSGLDATNHFSELAFVPEDQYEDSFETDTIPALEEIEQNIQLQNLAEAFKELKVTPALMLEWEAPEKNI